MALSRETIMSALFTRLTIAMTGLSSSTRRALSYERFPPETQPAMVLIQGDDDAEQQPDLPTKWRTEAIVFLYVRVPEDPAASPDATMNTLRGQLEDALKRTTTESGGGDDYWTTLGGLCERCWISGQVLYAQDVESGQSVARIPLEILAVEP